MSNLHVLAGHNAPVWKSTRPEVQRAKPIRESDACYFSRRAREERAISEQVDNSVARILHLELADRYAGLSAAIREAQDKLG